MFKEKFLTTFVDIAMLQLNQNPTDFDYSLITNIENATFAILDGKFIGCVAEDVIVQYFDERNYEHTETERAIFVQIAELAFEMYANMEDMQNKNFEKILTKICESKTSATKYIDYYKENTAVNFITVKVTPRCFFQMSYKTTIYVILFDENCCAISWEYPKPLSELQQKFGISYLVTLEDMFKTSATKEVVAHYHKFLGTELNLGMFLPSDVVLQLTKNYTPSERIFFVVYNDSFPSKDGLSNELWLTIGKCRLYIIIENGTPVRFAVGELNPESDDYIKEATTVKTIEDLVDTLYFYDKNSKPEIF